VGIAANVAIATAAIATAIHAALLSMTLIVAAGRVMDVPLVETDAVLPPATRSIAVVLSRHMLLR
jgi:hypothetical protein